MEPPRCKGQRALRRDPSFTTHQHANKSHKHKIARRTATLSSHLHTFILKSFIHNTPTRKQSHLAHVHNTLHSQHTNTQTVTPSHARGSSLVLLLFNTTRIPPDPEARELLSHGRMRGRHSHFYTQVAGRYSEKVGERR